MIEKVTDKTTLFQFCNLQAHNEITHFISTRNGGFSKPPYHSFNLGLHVGDAPEDVERNRFRLAAETAIPPKWFTYANQIHGKKVTIVSSQMRGMGSSDYASSLPNTDAMITDVEDVCLIVLVADCVPILLFDPTRRVIGAVHAGWHGTVQQIARITIHSMTTKFGCDPRNIIAGLGPSIGPCCYEVGENVISAVKENLGSEFIRSDNFYQQAYFDLWEANRQQLIAAGLHEENIEVAGICTHCHNDLFFSHRKEGITGRFGAAIMIRNEICASCTAIHCNWCNKE